MTYETGIPEYAMQPAKAPQISPAEAVYHTERMNYPAEKKTTVYQFEEDILVPDTKADMREILLMEACCDVVPTEKKILPKTDDLLNLTGMMTIQTIYQPEESGEKDRKLPVAITSKLPYKFQWRLNPENTGEGVFRCRVKNLEHMVINERKFRVKVTLEFSVQLFCQRELQFFHGLKDESLEMKSVELPLICLALVKRDRITIDEQFRIRETERTPEQILLQSFAVAENYRQVTTEKVVINGFIFVTLIYQTKGDNEHEPMVYEHRQRMEFTQFVPIEKDYRGKKWSTVKPSFSAEALSVVIEQEDDETAAPVFHVKGDLETRIELYEQKQQEMIVDAYHREKHFCCRFVETTFLNLSDGAIVEYNGREVIHLPDGQKAVEATACDCKVGSCDCRVDGGKIEIQGEVSHKCLWRDSEGCFHVTSQPLDFYTTIDLDQAGRETFIRCAPMVKHCVVTLINEKQLELNYTLLLQCESYEALKLTMMEEPGFTTGGIEREYPMAVTVLKAGESLWDLAKRYRTTEKQIRLMNKLTEEPMPGQKLLMIK